MSHSGLIAFLRGYVQCQIEGSQLESLLNAVLSKRMDVWNIRRVDEHTVRWYISVDDFFRLRPFLKQTGCRVRILGKFGLPFQLAKLWKRKFFVGGMFFFIIGLYLLSNLILSVEIEGNETLDKKKIQEAAQSLGIRPFQWKFSLPELSVLSKQLMSRLNGAAWVGVEVQGTRVRIKVVESTRPEKEEKKSPRNLIASHNALVTKIIAEIGRPVVEVNRYVKKGDLLILGVIGNEENQKQVAAKGEVLGIVWEKAAVELPLSRSRKAYTGEKKKQHYLIIGSRALRLTGYGEPRFERYEAFRDIRKIRWRNLELPLGWISETLYDVEIIEEKLTPDQAKNLALQLARANVQMHAPEGKIVRENVLAAEMKKDSVKLEILFEVERDIAMEQPLPPLPPPASPQP